MPFLNSTGVALMGNEWGGQISLDDHALRSGQAHGWLTRSGPDVLISDPTDPPALWRWNLITGALTPVDLAGANEAACGGGVMAWWHGVTGLHTSTGLHLPNAGLITVGEDGEIAYTPDRNLGLGVTVREISGGEWHLTDGVTEGLNLHGYRRALWADPRANFRIRVHGLKPCVQAGPARGPVAINNGGEWWVLYWVDGLGLLLHPFSSTKGYVVTKDAAFGFAGCVLSPSSIKVAWARTKGEQPGDLVTRAIDLTSPRQELTPPFDPPEPHPVSVPIYTNDQVYDLTEFMLCEPQFQARSGPSHPMSLIGPSREGRFYFVKFGDPRAYELLAFDADWIMQLEDASSSVTNFYSNQRWYPRYMRIGETHQFVTDRHERTYAYRDDCQRIRSEPVRRRMWIYAVYDAYDWSTDLGVRPTMLLVYDPTDGIHSEDRGIELGFYAKGAGWVRWEYHRSDVVFASGKARFSAASLIHRSDFYLLGDRVIIPTLSHCVSGSIPHFPPWEPDTEPEPEPEPAPEEPMIAYGPIMPGFHSGEEIDLGNGRVAINIGGGRVLTVTPDGKFEDRPEDAIGEWETFDKTATGYVARRGDKTWPFVRVGV